MHITCLSDKTRIVQNSKSISPFSGFEGRCWEVILGKAINATQGKKLNISDVSGH